MRAAGHVDAGVAVNDVEPAVPGDHRVDDLGDLGRVGDVRLDDALPRSQVHPDDLGAHGPEQSRGGRSDTARRAGDQDDPAVEAAEYVAVRHGHAFLLSGR